MQKIEKKTKIFATIGPSSDNHDMMKALFEAGMNVIRLNFSHGDHEEQRNKIVIAQQIEKEENQLIGVDLDTKGPEIRTGRFVGNMSLSRRATKSFSRWDVKMLTETISSVESKMMEPS